MGNWTVQDIATGIALLVALVSGVIYLTSQLKKWIELTLDSKFKALNKRIDDLEEKMDRMDIEACKNFLVRFLSDLERGDMVTEVEKKRFWDEYKYYTDHGGNSYIHEWVEKLKKKEYL